MSGFLQQFRLIFRLDSPPVIDHRNHHLIVRNPDRHIDSRIFMAKFHGIGKQIPNNGFNHLYIHRNLIMPSSFLTYRNIFYCCNRTHHLYNPIGQFRNIDHLGHNGQFSQLAFSPFQQIIQQGKNLFGSLIAHFQHIEYFSIHLLLLHTHHNRIQQHFHRCHWGTKVMGDYGIQLIPSGYRLFQLFRLLQNDTLGCHQRQLVANPDH